MDKITIKKLEIFANHGVFAEEKALGQKYLISVEMYADLKNAAKTDNLEYSIDYGKICHNIKDFAEKNTFNLIESVAEGIATRLLRDNIMLKKVVVEVEKPNAPIPLPFESVSVKIIRQRHVVYIALGSNIGDRDSHLQFGVSGLNKAGDCSVTRVSEFINTAPYGNVNQTDFLNGCLELETLLSPHELLTLTKEIEQKSGRVRSEHWGPRTLDLDIIFFDDMIISDDKLRIPHIDAHRRDFVLKPMAEIAPNFFHPIYMKTVRELLEELEVEQ